MKHLHLDQSTFLKLDQPLAVAIGYFDGLHLGHMSLVKEAVDYAKKYHIESALMTFSPSPAKVLGMVEEERYITDLSDRIEILETVGVDYIIEVDFTKEVASMSPDDFIKHYLIQQNVAYVVCGFDFTFGHRGLGTGETLKQYDDTFKVCIKEAIEAKNEKISSSRIRRLLEEGQIEEANLYLNRPYRIKGYVFEGRKIGRKIGFPTANINYGNYLLPKRGVYAIKARIDQKDYIGMCNIGYNPTFTALDRLSLEVHLFDFHEDIYHHEMKVYFYHFIRDERPFDYQEELMNQLNQDKQAIKEYFIGKD